MDTSNKKNIYKAVGFSVIYSLSMSLLSLFAKLAAPYTNNAMTVFALFGTCMLYLLIVLAILRLKGEVLPLKTNQLKLHIFRACAASGTQFASFYALRYIPIMDTNTLFMTYPIFVLIISILFLGAKNLWSNWVAITLGFAGILCVLKPGAEMFHPASLIALLSGLFASISFLSAHELGKHDSAHTIIFYYVLFCFTITGIWAAFHWQTPSLQTLLYLLALGACGASAQEFVVRALIYAPAKIVAPLMYLIIAFSGLLDWLFWQQTPSLLSLIGISAIFAGSTITVLIANNKNQPDKLSAAS